ncbi:MAG: signal peptidase I [Candidatus Rokubacteria bacterium]|nr:signal peptidase I [Candidatus Rokubacteria bacterium]
MKRVFWLAVFAALVAVLVALPAGVSNHFLGAHVLGESMLPSLLHGDRVIVDRYFSFREPRLGDVVLIYDTVSPTELLIKRIIGVPGDRIFLKDHDIFVNCRPGDAGCAPIDEPWAYHDPRVPRHDDRGPIRVPRECYWVMGDNRNLSADSRTFGVVPRASIIGRVVLIYWSYGAADGIRWTRLGRFAP